MRLWRKVGDREWSDGGTDLRSVKVASLYFEVTLIHIFGLIDAKLFYCIFKFSVTQLMHTIMKSENNVLDYPYKNDESIRKETDDKKAYELIEV